MVQIETENYDGKKITFTNKQRDQEFGKCCTNQSKVMRLLTAEIKKGK